MGIRFTSIKMKTTLVFATLVAITLAIPEPHHKHHEMPKSLQVLAKLPQLLKKVKGDPIKDCTKCYSDIMNAIEDCGNEEDILKCVEDVLMSASDCVHCICDILAIIGGGDASNCDPAEIKKFIKKTPQKFSPRKKKKKKKKKK